MQRLRPLLPPVLAAVVEGASLRVHVWAVGRFQGAQGISPSETIGPSRLAHAVTATANAANFILCWVYSTCGERL